MGGIGIFGGTFDPIHLGHLRSARDVCEQLSLDAMQFIPSAVPVHRDFPAVSADHRLNMVSLAIESMPSWSVNNCEIMRGGASYMVDTLKHIRQTVGYQVPLWLLVGSDAFEGFVKWHRWQEILTLTHLAVMVRAGIEPVGCEQTQLLLNDDWDTRSPVSAGGQIKLLSVTPLDISATRIRSGLARGSYPDFLVTPEVLSYIKEHGLYHSVKES